MDTVWSAPMWLTNSSVSWCKRESHVLDDRFHVLFHKFMLFELIRRGWVERILVLSQLFNPKPKVVAFPLNVNFQVVDEIEMHLVDWVFCHFS